VFVELLIVLDYFLLVVLQGIEGVEEWKHGLREMLSLTDVHLHEEGQRDVVEDVLSQTVECIVREVLEQLGFLSERHVVLKVISKLLGIGMHIGVDEVAELVELDTIGYRLPAKVARVVTVGRGFLPLATAAEHGITDQT
jgi:hypothetical protein